MHYSTLTIHHWHLLYSVQNLTSWELRNAEFNRKLVSEPHVFGAPDILTRVGIVFEDAPSGVRSGRAAGCKTIALLTSHSKQQVESSNPDYIIKDMSW